MSTWVMPKDQTEEQLAGMAKHFGMTLDELKKLYGLDKPAQSKQQQQPSNNHGE